MDVGFGCVPSIILILVHCPTQTDTFDEVSMDMIRKFLPSVLKVDARLGGGSPICNACRRANITTFLILFPLVSIQAADPVDFVRDIRPVFVKHCYECHSEKEQESGFRLDVKEAALKGGDNHGPDIVPGKASNSPLIRFITSDKKNEVMPPAGKLSMADIEKITRWVNEGAVWPEGVDQVQLKDTRDHWSFKPLASSFASIESEFSNPSDSFLNAKLAEHQLLMSSETDRASWIRRVSFDLIGLPPTPDLARRFLHDNRHDAFERAVDELLDSERYGERWAQHWLDVVRYADTHGFEVNTERPNAWPYRDYVIRAFNKDTPYDRFIREQIVGDLLGEDAATGFLVTASVLLSGQIGKDAPSIRLARQDSLDEIVNNIGQTFLGLSIGCARCHDHKFDPISARDYYAMQAFVAGVEYEDRKMKTADSHKQDEEAKSMRSQIAAIDNHLAMFAPLARPATVARITKPTDNVESFPPIEARFVRFTIHDSNVHPELGLIEPCLDEFEIFTDEREPQNVAIANSGVKVSASGSKESAIHKLEHVNDGQFGNERSWMSNTKGSGWIQFELPKAAHIAKVVWSRDRNGRYSDRLATAFTLEVGLSADALTTVTQLLPLRPTVRPSLNTDRLEPTKTQRLRFTIFATNGLEPCLDEIEVFNTAGENVALASYGTQVRTSGNTIVADRHEPRYINDGQYGNSRSWLSNELNKGWVELEFPREEEIDRVVWSRDRTGKLVDRNTTGYQIEVAKDESWKLVADSSDRIPAIAGTGPSPSFTMKGLTDADAAEASKLLAEKGKLEKNLKQIEAGQLVFAGKFRAPDAIHLLSRGDPEQPKEEVLPAVIAALGDVRLSNSTPEQERRRVLAEWIASPTNPLTARVMVNRIWQGHFGTGLVMTPSDFGNNGMKPTHPELLDWLATEFIRSGWSMKHMHRLIVLSHAYRQQGVISKRAADSVQSAATLDANVRFLWRYPSRRLEAEAIRDSMLAVSGLLNQKMFGRGYDLFDKRGGLSGFEPIEKLTAENQRRMIYAHKVRRETEAVFGAFDCPDAGQSAALRRMSTTPIQALNLFNSPFTLDVSEALSQRVKVEVGDKIEEQIQHTFQLTLSRSATPDELDVVEPFIREHGLAAFCRVLFNSNEFLFIP
jgi:mono/diheme cytochrome c family protein